MHQKMISSIVIYPKKLRIMGGEIGAYIRDLSLNWQKHKVYLSIRAWVEGAGGQNRAEDYVEHMLVIWLWKSLSLSLIGRCKKKKKRVLWGGGHITSKTETKDAGREKKIREYLPKPPITGVCVCAPGSLKEPTFLPAGPLWYNATTSLRRQACWLVLWQIEKEGAPFK